MLVHNHRPDQCELVACAEFAEDLDEEVASADGAEERQTAVTTAGDEVEVTLTVAAFETCRQEMKMSKASHPFKHRRDGAPT